MENLYRINMFINCADWPEQRRKYLVQSLDMELGITGLLGRGDLVGIYQYSATNVSVCSRCSSQESQEYDQLANTQHDCDLVL